MAFPCHSPRWSCRCVSPQPRRINPPVCPLPRSLATTCGISVDFFSSPYLDVSVQAVPLLRLFDSTQDDRVLLCRVSPFGDPGIDAYVQLPQAYRSLSRPSSAPDAKAFPLRSFQLDLVRSKSPRSSWFYCSRIMQALYGRSFWLIALPFKFPQFRLSRFPRLAVGLASFRLGLHLKPSASVSVLAPVHPNLLGGSALLKNPLLLALHFWNVFFVVQFSRCNL